MKSTPARISLLLALQIALLLGGVLQSNGQIIPDRITILDPLADTSLDTAGTTWLPGGVLLAEFARYSSGSGDDHRWNAKTGGYMEIVRVDSLWSVAAVGTMELVADPQNDITFNPRAIFWEEGLLASRRLGTGSALQFGYIHRCKHDIDNLEIQIVRGVAEQRTLIYSGLVTRYLMRPRAIENDLLPLELGGALRNDFFLHLLDSRIRKDAENVGLDIESLVDAASLTLRADIRPNGKRYGAHLSGSVMMSLFGRQRGFTERFNAIRILGSIPFLELGFDIFNPQGGSFTLFARGEWQRDAGVRTRPEAKNLFMVGIRMGNARTIW